MPAAVGGVPARESDAYARYVLGVLFLVYVFNFIDRQILGMLLDDIKQDMAVSDTAMGLLAGFAFVVFYTVAGIPIARLSDRSSRRMVIAVGLLLWSAMTAASGLARNFVQLALARVAVGVGEAAGSPPSHSLLADYFPLGRRATAFAIFSTGVYVGSMLAMLAGGYLKQSLGWRGAFLAVGAPGVLLALLVRFTVVDPPRIAGAGLAAPRFGEVLRHLLSCRSFLFLVAAASVQSLAGYSVLVWGPAFLGRVHGMSGVEIGTWLGLIIGIAGCFGAYAGGRLTDLLARRDMRWYMRFPAAQTLACVPFVAAFLLAGDGHTALLCFIPFYALGAMYVGPMHALGQSLVPPAMRATTSAILLFVVNLVGLGLGPFLVGLFNDTLFIAYGTGAIRYSLLTLGVAGGLSSLLFWAGSRSLLDDLARVVPLTQQLNR